MFKPDARKRDLKKKRGPAKKRIFKKRPCKFCIEKITTIDYLDYPKFQKYLTDEWTNRFRLSGWRFKRRSSSKQVSLLSRKCVRGAL